MIPMRGIVLAGILLGALLRAEPAEADEDCKLIREASLDLASDPSGRIDVPASVGGHTLSMLVDTGGVLTMLTDSSVDRLGLSRAAIPAARIEMFGGTQIKHFVEIRDFSLGGVKMDRAEFLVLPDDRSAVGVDGLLAPDVLTNFDVDFDFANAKLNLFSPDHCHGRVVYWSQTAAQATLPVELDRTDHILIHLRIDGEDIRAVVDTGASATVLSLEKAEDMFNLTEASPGMKRLAPPGVQKSAYRYPFKLLDLDGVAVNNPDIILVPDDVSHLGDMGPQMILGMNVLRQLHLYVAYRENNLYVTAAGAH